MSRPTQAPPPIVSAPQPVARPPPSITRSVSPPRLPTWKMCFATDKEDHGSSTVMVRSSYLFPSIVWTPCFSLMLLYQMNFTHVPCAEGGVTGRFTPNGFVITDDTSLSWYKCFACQLVTDSTKISRRITPKQANLVLYASSLLCIPGDVPTASVVTLGGACTGQLNSLACYQAAIKLLTLFVPALSQAMQYIPKIAGLESGDGHGGWLISSSRGVLVMWLCSAGGGAGMPSLMVRRGDVKGHGV